MRREILLPSPHPAWHAREGLVPGTAIQMEGELWEIVSVEKDEQGFRYILEPWQDNQTIRSYYEFDLEREKKRLKEEHKAYKKRALSPLFILWFGLLPKAMQKDFSKTWGFDPGVATLLNSSFLFFATAVPVVLSFLGLLHGISLFPSLILSYFMLECFLRFLTAFLFHEPKGSLLTFFLWGYKKAKQETWKDEVHVKGDHLICFSHYVKPHWKEGTGIIWQGKGYRFHTHKYTQFHHIYTFLQTQENPSYPPLDLQKEEQRNKRNHYSYVLAPLWGFLPSRHQKIIASFGSYNPQPYTLMSFSIIGIWSLAALVVDTYHLVTQTFSISHLLRLGVAMALAKESLSRFYTWLTKKEPSGSIVGYLFVPLFRLIFEDRTG